MANDKIEVSIKDVPEVLEYLKSYDKALDKICGFVAKGNFLCMGRVKKKWNAKQWKEWALNEMDR